MNEFSNDQESIDRKLSIARIRHLNAEAQKYELEARWQKGWRAFVKPVTAGLVSVGLIVWYAMYYFSTELKFRSSQVEVVNHQLDQAKKNLKSLEMQNEESEANLANVKLEIARERDQHDAVFQERQRLSQQLNEAQVKLSTTQASQQESKRIITELGEQLQRETNQVIEPKNRPFERKEVMRNLFRSFNGEGFKDYLLADALSKSSLEKHLSGINLPEGEVVLAVLDTVGGSIVFGTNAIYIFETFGGESTIPYVELREREFTTKGFWDVSLGSGIDPISTSGVSIKREELIRILTAIRSTVQSMPELFN